MKLRLVKEYDPVPNDEFWYIERRCLLVWWDRISARYDTETAARALFERLQRQGTKIKRQVVETV